MNVPWTCEQSWLLSQVHVRQAGEGRGHHHGLPDHLLRDHPAHLPGPRAQGGQHRRQGGRRVRHRTRAQVRHYF